MQINLSKQLFNCDDVEKDFVEDKKMVMGFVV